MNDTNKIEPDYWVAWEPKFGPVLQMAAEKTEEEAWESLGMMVAFSLDGDIDPGARIEQLKKDGWRIRPVKFQFLDEE